MNCINGEDYDLREVADEIYFFSDIDITIEVMNNGKSNYYFEIED